MSEPNGSIESVDDGPDRSRDIGTVVVTGANSGLGFEVTKALAEAGAHVVMACRSVERGEKAKREIEREVPEASLVVHELDLADLDSVAAFAEWFESAYDELDVLCNNATVRAVARKETADGFEYQFGVNHLGHFALTAHLSPVLEQTTGESRVITQSSVAHWTGEIDFEDLQHENSYDDWEAYGQSKLANVLFAYELDRYFPDDAGVKSIACQPELAVEPPDARSPAVRLSAPSHRDTGRNRHDGQRAEHGAKPMLYAAVNQSVESGGYVCPNGGGYGLGFPELRASSERSYDEELARRLWGVSEDLTGVSFDSSEPT